MNSKKKMSFIIPAHNAENVLKRCVESIVGCGVGTEAEILIIENGSTDGTTQEAELLQNKYDNVALYHSDKGVSVARNHGIRVAEGEYLFFVDADDYLVEDGIQDAISELQETHGLIIFGYEKGSGVVNTTEERTAGSGGRTKEQTRAGLIANPTKFMAVWGKAFRRECIVNNAIWFNENLVLAEDGDFMIRYTQVCDDIHFSDKILYHYSTEDVSTVRSFDGKKVREYQKALKVTAEHIKTEGTQIQLAFKQYILMHLNLMMVHEVFAKENPMGFREKVQWLKQVSQEPIFQTAIKSTFLKECKSLRMMPVLFIKTHMFCAAGLIYWVRVRQHH